MSLVGPRPLFDDDTQLFNTKYMRRLNVLPGITGLLQINERNTSEFETWYKYDIEYIENWSIYLDLKIIFKTPLAIFSKKIRQGETYQIKICTKYKNKSLINPVNFFWKLMRVNASPESFMIKDKDYSIVSCSPETLIDKKKNKIITKPIAGTFKKKYSSNKNTALKYFKNYEKEAKEHNMIVDMERSDLSKICKPGSVKILKKKYVEEYKHLFHYVTSIGGILNKNTKLIDIIKAMMPGGSVIGCPKIRTLELLNKQEKESRNIFTGSFGFIKFNQDMKFNIIIRSILNYKNQSEISAASGVVLDSSPKKEFNENYIKAKSLLELFK